MSKACRPEPILKRMGAWNCPTAKAFLREMGSVIPVNEVNIRKAVDLVSPPAALRFCRHWLEWEDAALWRLTHQILYPQSRRSRYYDMLHGTRHRIAKAAIVAAIIAYRKEMEKP